MALELLEERLKRELEPINSALAEAVMQLPAPCQPVAAHIIEAGGKRLRPFLTILCANIFGDSSPCCVRLGACLEMLHAATLLHDDVLDNASSRRNRPSAHIIFGIAQTILAGDALLALGNDIVASYANPALCQCYSEATMKTAAGEILEMNSLRKPDLAPSEYLEIAKGKTACLIAQACVMGALKAGANSSQVEACREYGENIGIAFQLVDDALDFASKHQTGKPIGGDLREGKLTPPLRLYRDSLEQREREHFDKAFTNAAFSELEIQHVIESAAAFAEQSLLEADICIGQAKTALERLPECQDRKILFEMADYVRQRKN